MPSHSLGFVWTRSFFLRRPALFACILGRHCRIISEIPGGGRAKTPVTRRFPGQRLSAKISPLVRFFSASTYTCRTAATAADSMRSAGSISSIGRDARCRQQRCIARCRARRGLQKDNSDPTSSPDIPPVNTTRFSVPPAGRLLVSCPAWQALACASIERSTYYNLPPPRCKKKMGENSFFFWGGRGDCEDRIGLSCSLVRDDERSGPPGSLAGRLTGLRTRSCRRACHACRRCCRPNPQARRLGQGSAESITNAPACERPRRGGREVITPLPDRRLRAMKPGPIGASGEHVAGPGRLRFPADLAGVCAGR